MTLEQRYNSARQALDDLMPPDDDVKRLLAEIDDVFSELVGPAAPKPGIAALLERHRDHMRRRECVASSIKARSLRLQALATWASPRSVLELNRDDIEHYLDCLHLAPGSRGGYLSHFRMFYEWAVDEGYAKVDPTRRIEPPRPRLEPVHLISVEDLGRAIEKAPDPVRSFLLLAAGAGLKPSEMAALRGRDVDRVNGRIHVRHRKSGRDRPVPLHDAVARVLPDRTGPLFLLHDGRPMKSHNVSHLGNRYLHGIGIDATLIQIRHRFATDFYWSSLDLLLTQQVLGHATPASTAAYASADMTKAAGAVSSLELGAAPLEDIGKAG